MTKPIIIIVILLSSVFLWLGPDKAETSTQTSNEPPDSFKTFSFTAKEVTAASGDSANIVDVWEPSHEGRHIASDPCPGDNGIIDDHIFWLDRSSFSNNYAGRDSKYLLVIINDFILSAPIDAIGGGYGYYPELVGRGRYALCIDLKGFAFPLVIDRIKKNVALIHQEPLYEPVKVMIALDKNNQPTLTWSNASETGDRIIIFRDYDNQTTDLPITSKSWTDSNAPCGKTIRYWLASANQNGESRWTDEVKVTTASCEGNKAVLDFGGRIFDDRSERFSIVGDSWLEENSGYQNHHFWATNTTGIGIITATWLVNPASSGKWEIYVYVPETATTAQAAYTIYHNNQTASVTINQEAYHNYWVSLGTFDFAGQGEEYVTLSNNTGEPTGTTLVAFDAVGIKWVGEDKNSFPQCTGTLGMIISLSAFYGFSTRRKK